MTCWRSPLFFLVGSLAVACGDDGATDTANVPSSGDFTGAPTTGPSVTTGPAETEGLSQTASGGPQTSSDSTTSPNPTGSTTEVTTGVTSSSSGELTGSSTGDMVTSSGTDSGGSTSGTGDSGDSGSGSSGGVVVVCGLNIPLPPGNFEYSCLCEVGVCSIDFMNVTQQPNFDAHCDCLCMDAGCGGSVGGVAEGGP